MLSKKIGICYHVKANLKLKWLFSNTNWNFQWNAELLSLEILKRFL